MFFFFMEPSAPELPPDVQALLKSQGLTWEQIESLLGTLREIKSDLSVGALQTFLYIARRAGAVRTELPYVKTVAEGLGVQYSTAARHCDVLSDGVGGSGGLGLIMKIDDPATRAKYLTLTDAGVAILTRALKNGVGLGYAGLDRLEQVYASGPVHEVLVELKRMRQLRDSEADPDRQADMDEEIASWVGGLPELIRQIERE
jgi:DNA-binding MarR family transcriptional regulator